MSAGGRGILYIIWGTEREKLLQRSIESVRKHCPAVPIHVERIAETDPPAGLRHKTRMGSLTPFETTLYLDADTMVLGDLEFAFVQAERFGLACCLCECPWARRYGVAGDGLEYNTGVLFFSPLAREVFRTWERIAPTTPARSRWTALDDVVRASEFDDQASFSRAVEQCGSHPFVLPLNYNYRPDFFRHAFAPIKIWHDGRDLPSGLEDLNQACERGERPVTVLEVLAKP